MCVQNVPQATPLHAGCQRRWKVDLSSSSGLISSCFKLIFILRTLEEKCKWLGRKLRREKRKDVLTRNFECKTLCTLTKESKYTIVLSFSSCGCKGQERLPSFTLRAPPPPRPCPCPRSLRSRMERDCTIVAPGHTVVAAGSGAGSTLW